MYMSDMSNARVITLAHNTDISIDIYVVVECYKYISTVKYKVIKMRGPTRAFLLG